ncbi:MAG: hypothetical protein JW763_08875 [candidate division Zixibacteria bacterium]|nr:hypothetical protein [candidate division Zixibacteria bacterium]
MIIGKKPKSSRFPFRWFPLLLATSLIIASGVVAGEYDFTDDFDDGDMAGWTVIEMDNSLGNASITTLQTHSDGYAALAESNSGPMTTAVRKDNFEAAYGLYEAWFYVSGDAADARMYFQLEDQDNYYLVRAVPRNSDIPGLYYDCCQDGVITSLAAVPAYFDTDEWFKLTIIRYGNGNTKILIDDVLQIFRNDIVKLTPGAFCVGSRQLAYIDDIRFTGITPSAVMIPSLQYIVDAQAVVPLMDTVYLGNLDTYTVNDIDPTTIRFNNTVTPVSWSILPSHPDFDTEVMEIILSRREFILSFGLLFDSSMQVYTMDYTCPGKCAERMYGLVAMRGHLSGDANGDDKIDMVDIYYIADHLYKNGPAPIPVSAAGDFNRDSRLDLLDMLDLIYYLYGQS